MTLVLIIAGILILVFIYGLIVAPTSKGGSPMPQRPVILNKHLESSYKNDLKQLKEDDEHYHHMLQLWKDFHTKYESLGEPTLRVGYSQRDGRWPWEMPNIHIPYGKIAAEPDPGKRIDMVTNASIQLHLDYGIDAIGQSATFWKEARTAVFGREEAHPEDLVSIKSNIVNVAGKHIRVTITTTILESPTIELIFDGDDRGTVDELKAAFNAFKALKK